jgi:hypothetical protein
MAIYRGWSTEELGKPFKKIFNVPKYQRVVVQQLGESEYQWGLEAIPGHVTNPLKFEFELDFDWSTAEVIGEWLSRTANAMMHLLSRVKLQKQATR